MSSPCDRFEDVWELALLGSAEPELLHTMQVHLRSGCPSCQANYLDAQRAVASLGTTVPQLQPSPAIEARLEARLNQPVAANPRKLFVPAFTPWLIAAASLAVILWMGADRARLVRQLSVAQAKSSSPLSPAVPLPAPSPKTPPLVGTSQASALQAKIEELRRRVDADARARAVLAAEKNKLQEEATAAPARIQDLEQQAKDTQAQLTTLRNMQEKTPRPEALPPVTDQGAQLAALNRQLAQKDAEIQASATAIRQYASTIANLRQVLRVLDAPSLKEVEMKSVDTKTRGASARALIAPGAGLVVVARQLPKLPPDKCYQLWIIRQGAPAIVSGGILTTDPDGGGIVFVPSIQSLLHASGFAITDEPAGGSVSAQGHKLLFGAVS